MAARYVEAMKDMDGRKPGPSSILGKLSSCLENKTKSICVAGCLRGNGLTLFPRGVAAEAWTGRRLPSPLQPRGDGLWSCYEVHVHWTQVRYFVVVKLS